MDGGVLAAVIGAIGVVMVGAGTIVSNIMVARRTLAIQQDSAGVEARRVDGDARRADLADRDNLIESMRTLIVSQNEKIQELEKELKQCRDEVVKLRQVLESFELVRKRDV